MARAARKMTQAERLHESSFATEQQSSSFLSLYRAEASQAHAPPNLEVTSEIQCVRNQSRYTILALLLGTHTDVRRGMLVHHYVVCKGLESSLFLGSHLLHMYFRCGSNENGFVLFACMCDRNVYSWNYLMQASSNDKGETQKPITFFCRMQEEAVLPNKVTFLTITRVHMLRPVGVDFERIHVHIRHSEFGQDIILGTAVLQFYGACGRMEDASIVFNAMVSRDVVLWTTMINLFAEQGEMKEALYLLEQMQQEGITPTSITFAGLLGACAKHAAVEDGKLIHAQILADGLESDVAISNALVYMYGNCASLDDGCTVFDKMLERNVATWTSMITFYSQKGYGKEAVFLYDWMQCEAVLPNQFTFVSTIVACACFTGLDIGKHLHTSIQSCGIIDAITGAALVNMYDKCGSLLEAEKVFINVSERDLVLWNAMIGVYAQNKKLKEAIELFESMQVEGLHPDKTTFSYIFAVCAECAQHSQGERVHAYIMERGVAVETAVVNSLVHMYARCGELDYARSIFDNLVDRDVVSWTVMIAGCALYGQWESTLSLFDQMQQEGHLPDKVTYISILDSCGHSPSQVQYRCIHARLEKSELHTDTAVQNALISIYGKWGNCGDAERLYGAMSERDVVTWNTMVGVYSRNGKLTEMFEVFKHMCHQGVTPDRVTFVSILSMCASQAIFAEGRYIHMWVVDVGCELDNVLGTAILVMYGKCGSLEDARSCFDNMQKCNVLTWNAMMSVYSQHAQGIEVIDLFLTMQREMVLPDALSYLAVIVACSHAGLVDEGKIFITSMVQEHGLSPTSDHYGCLIDLFGRAGQLDEAKDFICSLPFLSGNASLAAALSVCKQEDDMDEEESVASWHAFELDSDNPIYKVILSNFCFACSKYKKAMEMMNFEEISSDVAL